MGTYSHQSPKDVTGTYGNLEISWEPMGTYGHHGNIRKPTGTYGHLWMALAPMEI